MADETSGQTDNGHSGTQRSNGVRLPAAKDFASGFPELPPDWDSCPTTQIPAVPEPIPARRVQAPPPRPPGADAAVTQANRKLAWLLAGVVTVAGGLLIGFLRAITPADVPAPVVTPRPAAGENASDPSDAPSQPLPATPEPTGTWAAPPPSPGAAPSVGKVAPKPTLRPVRPRVPATATPTTTRPTTRMTTKSAKKDKSSSEIPTIDY